MISEIFHIPFFLKRLSLYQLFTKAVHISTLVEQNKINMGFLITNDKASYVAQEDSICLFSFAKEAVLNKQKIKPCFPIGFVPEWCKIVSEWKIIIHFFNVKWLHDYTMPCIVFLRGRVTNIPIHIWLYFSDQNSFLIR